MKIPRHFGWSIGPGVVSCGNMNPPIFQRGVPRFLALESGWLDGGKRLGFSHHLATDRELMAVELPGLLDLHSSGEVVVGLDIDGILSSPNRIRLFFEDLTDERFLPAAVPANPAEK